jgi:hypothetical protein
VFYLVIPEHKFEFSFVINSIHNKRELADIVRRRAIKYIFDASNKYVFSTKFIPEMRNSTYAVKVKAIFVSRREYDSAKEL